jgi:hypothetical protein
MSYCVDPYSFLKLDLGSINQCVQAGQELLKRETHLDILVGAWVSGFKLTSSDQLCRCHVPSRGREDFGRLGYAVWHQRHWTLCIHPDCPSTHDHGQSELACWIRPDGMAFQLGCE